MTRTVNGTGHGAKLWGLGDFEGERKAAEELSKRSLAALANLDRIILNK